MEILILSTAAIVVAIVLAIYFMIQKKSVREMSDKANSETKAILAEAASQAKEIKLNAIQEINNLKQTIREKENNLQREISEVERRQYKLDSLAQAVKDRTDNLNQKKIDLANLERDLKNRESELDEKIFEISTYTKEQAREIVLEKAKSKITNSLAKWTSQQVDDYESEAKEKAIEFLTAQLPKYASDVVSERTTTRVSITNDEIKGKIIGREGRNIRAFEAATGVDLIVDDTPNVVTLSCFNPVRREVAKRALESLIDDGRIQPGSIEEAVNIADKKIQDEIMDQGYRTVKELGLSKIPKEIIKCIGTLKFRSSYGQNALKHSTEVARFSGYMAKQLGLDYKLAIRAGLLHDIGKALDFDEDGTHVELGADLCQKYNEAPEVINGIETHHGNKPPIGPIPILVTTADIISASRPGARRQSFEDYVQRLKALEDIANKHDAVEKVYAIKAGREIRVIVTPEKANDALCKTMAVQIKQDIEENLKYPGNIIVNVIRETRHKEIAQ